jgi:hypothetical protein
LLLDEGDVRLIHEHVAHELHHARRRLEVHGTAGERAERPPQWRERRGRVRVLVAQRDGVQPRDVELFPELEHVAADEGDIEVARAESVGVERLTIRPAQAGDGAAAEDHLNVGWRHFAKRRDKLLVALFVAAEGESDDARAGLPVRWAAAWGGVGTGHCTDSLVPSEIATNATMGPPKDSRRRDRKRRREVRQVRHL